MGFVTKGYGGMTTFLIGQKQHMAITGLQHTHPTLVRFRANVGLQSMRWVRSTYLKREIHVQKNSPN